MQLNRFIFDNYLATEEGKNALTFFKDFEKILKNKKKSAYFDFLNHIGILPVEKQQADAELKQFSEVVKIVLGDGRGIIELQNAIEELFQESGVESVISNGKGFIENELTSNKNITERDFMTFVRQWSIYLCLYAPQFCFPLLPNARLWRPPLQSLALGIGLTMLRSALNGFSTEEHFETAMQIKQLYEDSDFVGRFLDDRGDPNVVAMYRFQIPIVLTTGIKAVVYITQMSIVLRSLKNARPQTATHRAETRPA